MKESTVQFNMKERAFLQTDEHEKLKCIISGLNDICISLCKDSYFGMVIKKTTRVNKHGVASLVFYSDTIQLSFKSKDKWILDYFKVVYNNNFGWG